MPLCYINETAIIVNSLNNRVLNESFRHWSTIARAERQSSQRVSHCVDFFCNSHQLGNKNLRNR
jgi:hypothetical protein